MDPACDIFTTSYVYRSYMLEKLLTSTTPVMSLGEVLMLFLNTLVTHVYAIVYVFGGAHGGFCDFDTHSGIFLG